MIDLHCLTWNLHRCRGQDGRVDPARTASALCDLVAQAPVDLLVLTEADEECAPFRGLLDLEAVTAATGLVSAHGDPALRWGPESHGFLGAVVLHRPDWELVAGHLLDLPGHCPRGAAILTFRAAGLTLRVVAAHLSLGQPLRIVQMRAFGQYLARQADLPTLLIGDLNEWRPWGGVALSRGLLGRRFAGPVRRSFPSAAPVLPLDRLMAAPGGGVAAEVVSAEAVSSATLRRVSDHLPLRARVTLG